VQRTLHPRAEPIDGPPSKARPGRRIAPNGAMAILQLNGILAIGVRVGPRRGAGPAKGLFPGVTRLVDALADGPIRNGSGGGRGRGYDGFAEMARRATPVGCAAVGLAPRRPGPPGPGAARVAISASAATERLLPRTSRRCPGRKATGAGAPSSPPGYLELRSQLRVDLVESLCSGALSRQVEALTPLARRSATVE
jgi:hypothetical protein